MADVLTPVSLFLKLRDYFTEPMLLESNDFNSRENSYSFIGLEAIASIQVKNGKIITLLPGNKKTELSSSPSGAVENAIAEFLNQFDVS